MPKTAPKSSKKEVKSSKSPSKPTSKASAKPKLKPQAKSGPKSQSVKKEAKAPVKKATATKAVKAQPSKAATKKVGASGSSTKKVLPKKEGASAKSSGAKGLKKSEIKKTDAKKIESPKAESKKASSKKSDRLKSDKQDVKKNLKRTTEKLGDSENTQDEVSSSKGAKGGSKKKPSAKKEEFDIDDDLVGEGDDFANDELSEYEADLENAEEESEEREVVIEEVVSVTVTTTLKDKGDDIILTDADGRRYCRVKDCDQVATVDGYCRYHYLLLWKKIQVRKKILTDGKLERYVEELTSRYPDKFLEVIRRDLRTEKDFVSAIQEMEIDESGSDADFEDESSNFIDEVRGAAPESLNEDDDY